LVYFLVAFPSKSCKRFSSLHEKGMPLPSHPPWLDHSNYISRRLRVMKLLIIQFFPTSYHFTSLWFCLTTYSRRQKSSSPRRCFRQTVDDTVAVFQRPNSVGHWFQAPLSLPSTVSNMLQLVQETLQLYKSIGSMILKEVKASERQRSFSISQCTIPTCVCTNRGKLQNTRQDSQNGRPRQYCSMYTRC
jgi:hypothetical protein